MPVLRGKVIAVICEQEWPYPDNEVSSATIHERLQRGGDNASRAEVEQVLFQLNDRGDIILALDQGQQSGPVVEHVDEGLCP